MDDSARIHERPSGTHPSPGTPVGRRIFLSMLAFGGAGILWGAKVQDFLVRLLAPVTSSTGLGDLVPAAGGFRIYSVTGELPHRAPLDYTLKVGGEVQHQMQFSLADLKSMPAILLTKDFQCVTGWRVPKVEWRGVRLRDVLDAAGVMSGARAVSFASFDGTYTESLTLDQALRDDVIVAYEMQHGPISDEHGGPVRLYVAPMYGYKSIKWLSEINLTSEIVPGYWENRDYDVDAFIGKSNGRDDQPVR